MNGANNQFGRFIMTGAAMAAPAMFFAASMSWQGVILLTAVFFVLNTASIRFQGMRENSLITSLQIVVCILYISSVLVTFSELFESRVYSTILLLLGLLALTGTQRKMPKVAVILLGVMAALLLLLFLTALPKMQIRHLECPVGRIAWLLIPSLLFPSLPDKAEMKNTGFLLLYPLVSIWSLGLIGFSAAQAERFPALLAALQCRISNEATRLEGYFQFLIILGTFCTIGFLLTMIQEKIGESGEKSDGALYGIVTLIAVLVGTKRVLKPEYLAFSAVFAWFVLPVLQHNKKIRKKEQKKKEKP